MFGSASRRKTGDGGPGSGPGGGGSRGGGGGAGRGRGGARRMTIKLNKAKPKLPENFMETSWDRLAEAVAAIHTAQPVRHSREELYHMVEGLCMHKQAAELCTRLEKKMEAHIEGSIGKLVGQTPDHLAFLALVTETWQSHCQQMHSIRNLFLYLDRSYVISEASLRSLWDLGLVMFRRYFVRAADVQGKVISGFLHLIERERSGEAVNHSVCTAIMRMLVALELYESVFEEVFLRETRDFYRQESVRLLDSSPVPEYLQHVERRLGEEKQRVARYLDPQTRAPLVRSCESELVKNHVTFLLEKGFESLMDGGRADDLGRMYKLFARVDALKDMRQALYAYVKRRGLQVVQNEAEEKEMVPTLLKLKKDLDQLLAGAMQRHEEFERAMRDAFESFINSRENRPAELIAKFIDLQLRTGARGAGGEEETEALLERVVVLFRFLTAKDVFEAFYKKDLAKRLLLGRSASSDLERSMIAKLKTECGSNFTNKLEGMFKDIELSKDLMAGFAQSPQYASDQRPADVEMAVHVLTTGFWPAYPMMKGLRLPEVVVRCQGLFKDFYDSKHEGRKLAWQHSLCHLLVRAALPLGRKEFQVSLYQGMVLLLFNDGRDDLSLDAIKQETGMEDGELRRTLQSLACGKVRVLTKSPKGREVEDGDRFQVNAEFQSRQLRIKINSIQLKETAKESKQTHERVFQDRQYQIDAAIVRVMKSRKTLTHQSLLGELFKQLRFPAKSADLKKRIESLIDREYLERDEQDSSTYKYLA